MVTESVPQVCPYCHYLIVLRTPRQRYRDLTRQVFDQLTVQHCLKLWPGRLVQWCCTCSCGGAAIVGTDSLCRGYRVRCRNRGCVVEAHGMSRTPLYGQWENMIQRCHNPTNPDFPDYGGRGVVVCPRWRSSFLFFLADMGERPPDMEVERRNNDGPYSPDNCLWAPRHTQARNNRRNRYLTLNGVSKILQDWSAETGIPVSTIRHRLKKHWSVERALTTPINMQHSRGQRKSHAPYAHPWANHWDVCRICGGTESQHDAHGYCHRCYSKLASARASAAEVSLIQGQAPP